MNTILTIEEYSKQIGIPKEELKGIVKTLESSKTANTIDNVNTGVGTAVNAAAKTDLDKNGNK